MFSNRTLPEEKERTLAAGGREPNLRDPAVVMSLLEADQVVAAKSVGFGRRKLSRGISALLWGLRIYVIFMLAIVLISVLRALRAH